MSVLKQLKRPQTHPSVQTYQWLTNPLEYMEACAKRYGDVFTLQIVLIPERVKANTGTSRAITCSPTSRERETARVRLQEAIRRAGGVNRAIEIVGQVVSTGKLVLASTKQ